MKPSDPKKRLILNSLLQIFTTSRDLQQRYVEPFVLYEGKKINIREPFETLEDPKSGFDAGLLTKKLLEPEYIRRANQALDFIRAEKDVPEVDKSNTIDASNSTGHYSVNDTAVSLPEGLDGRTLVNSEFDFVNRFFEAFPGGFKFISEDFAKDFLTETDKSAFLQTHSEFIEKDHQKIVEGKDVKGLHLLLGETCCVKVIDVNRTIGADGKISTGIFVSTTNTHALDGHAVWGGEYDPQKPGQMRFTSVHIGNSKVPLNDRLNVTMGKQLLRQIGTVMVACHDKPANVRCADHMYDKDLKRMARSHIAFGAMNVFGTKIGIMARNVFGDIASVGEGGNLPIARISYAEFMEGSDTYLEEYTKDWERHRAKNGPMFEISDAPGYPFTVTNAFANTNMRGDIFEGGTPAMEYVLDTIKSDMANTYSANEIDKIYKGMVGDLSSYPSDILENEVLVAELWKDIKLRAYLELVQPDIFAANVDGAYQELKEAIPGITRGECIQLLGEAYRFEVIEEMTKSGGIVEAKMQMDFQEKQIVEARARRGTIDQDIAKEVEKLKEINKSKAEVEQNRAKAETEVEKEKYEKELNELEQELEKTERESKKLEELKELDKHAENNRRESEKRTQESMKKFHEYVRKTKVRAVVFAACPRLQATSATIDDSYDDMFIQYTLNGTMTVITAYRDLVWRFDPLMKLPTELEGCVGVYFPQQEGAVNVVIHCVNLHMVGGQTYSFPGKNVSIFARNIFTCGDGKAVIDLTGTRGADGPYKQANPKEATAKGGEKYAKKGNAGAPGEKGNPGTKGGDSGHLTIVSSQFIKQENFLFVLNGGAGGNGGQGQNGQPGQDGSDGTYGNNEDGYGGAGSKGGDGGDGGNAGAVGTVTFVYAISNVYKFEVMLCELVHQKEGAVGLPGQPGSNGLPGDGAVVRYDHKEGNSQYGEIYYEWVSARRPGGKAQSEVGQPGVQGSMHEPGMEKITLYSMSEQEGFTERFDGLYAHHPMRRTFDGMVHGYPYYKGDTTKVPLFSIFSYADTMHLQMILSQMKYQYLMSASLGDLSDEDKFGAGKGAQYIRDAIAWFDFMKLIDCSLPAFEYARDDYNLFLNGVANCRDFYKQSFNGIASLSFYWKSLEDSLKVLGAMESSRNAMRAQLKDISSNVSVLTQTVKGITFDDAERKKRDDECAARMKEIDDSLPAENAEVKKKQIALHAKLVALEQELQFMHVCNSEALIRGLGTVLLFGGGGMVAAGATLQYGVDRKTIPLGAGGGVNGDWLLESVSRVEKANYADAAAAYNLRKDGQAGFEVPKDLIAMEAQKFDQLYEEYLYKLNAGPDTKAAFDALVTEVEKRNNLLIEFNGLVLELRQNELDHKTFIKRKTVCETMLSDLTTIPRLDIVSQFIESAYQHQVERHVRYLYDATRVYRGLALKYSACLNDLSTLQSWSNLSHDTLAAAQSTLQDEFRTFSNDLATHPRAEMTTEIILTEDDFYSAIDNFKTNLKLKHEFKVITSGMTDKDMRRAASPEVMKNFIGRNDVRIKNVEVYLRGAKLKRTDGQFTLTIVRNGRFSVVNNSNNAHTFDCPEVTYPFAYKTEGVPDSKRASMGDTSVVIDDGKKLDFYLTGLFDGSWSVYLENSVSEVDLSNMSAIVFKFDYTYVAPRH